MPQISQILETYASQLFWLLITFGLIYFGIAKAMLPKIDAAVDARDRKIAEDLAAAEAAKAQVENLESGGGKLLAAARAEAQAKAADAKAKAARESETTLAKADAEIAEKLATAEAGLEKARAAAMTNIENVASEAAVEIAGKIAGVKVDGKAAARAVKMVMANG